MPDSKLRTVTCALVICVGLFVFCAREMAAQVTAPAPPVSPAMHDVTDGFGRTVRIPVNPSRFVSLAPSLTETLYALGVEDRLVGDTLRSNDVMIGLARKAGFAFAASPGDWKLVRFEKHIDAARQEIPCASWRLAAQQAQLQAAV